MVHTSPANETYTALSPETSSYLSQSEHGHRESYALAVRQFGLAVRARSEIVARDPRSGSPA